MSEQQLIENPVLVDYKRVARHFYLAIPLYIFVPVGYALGFRYAGIPVRWASFGIGTAGWMIALMLRGPIALLLKKTSKERAATIIGAASGPLEEGVRLAVLLFAGLSFQSAASIGQGWAAIEVLFTVVNGVVLAIMLVRTDEKSMQVKEVLENSGNLNQSPLLGVSERIFASAFHIGSTLLIAHNLWMAVVLIPAHSVFNLVTVRLVKKSAIGAEIFVAACGLTTFLAGIALF